MGVCVHVCVCVCVYWVFPVCHRAAGSFLIEFVNVCERVWVFFSFGDDVLGMMENFFPLMLKRLVYTSFLWKTTLTGETTHLTWRKMVENDPWPSPASLTRPLSRLCCLRSCPRTRINNNLRISIWAIFIQGRVERPPPEPRFTKEPVKGSASVWSRYLLLLLREEKLPVPLLIITNGYWPLLMVTDVADRYRY